MTAIVRVLCFSFLLAFGSALFDKAHPKISEPPADVLNITDVAHSLLSHGLHVEPSHPSHVDISAPILFPNKSDESTPILNGDNPTSAQLPPKYFPARVLDHSTEVSTHDNYTVSLNTTEGEASDMLHSKYTGGQDVDELKPQKKASEKDEKKPVSPKSEVVVSAGLDKNGPKLMNSSTGASILESTSKVMAESSSVLSKQTTHEKHQATLGPARTVASIMLSAAAVLCLAVIGLMVWKKIAMRKSGRDILINEEDFDDTSDMHTFDRARIQIA